MRLIDADKLRHELIMGHDLVGAKYTDIADTVDAIPVIWIAEWVTTHNTFSWSRMLHDWREENEAN